MNQLPLYNNRNGEHGNIKGMPSRISPVSMIVSCCCCFFYSELGKGYNGDSLLRHFFFCLTPPFFRH